MAMTTRTLLRAAGLLIWAFAGIPAAISIVRDTGCTIADVASVAAWVVAFSIFGVAFFRASGQDAPRIRLLALQTLAALAMNVVLCTGFEAALLVIVAVELGLRLDVARGLPWVLAQSAVLFALAAHHMGVHKTIYFVTAVVVAETFSFAIAAIAGREAGLRRVLERVNRELEATRETLARASADGERLRIARELHDLLGHDLIALHLELECALHLAEGASREPVERAQRVSQTLLADLRKAVSSLRDASPATDLAAVVRAFVAGVQVPRVHLDAPATLELPDAERAHALLRCVQEITTNTIKHAGATNLWLQLGQHDGYLRLDARDDGRGAASCTPGNGLEGMRERLAVLGGELVLDARPGEGFRVSARLPSRDGKARA
jgi:signal transduction histidine kinase